jgi:hypothetical protein
MRIGGAGAGMIGVAHGAPTRTRGCGEAAGRHFTAQ